VDNILNLNEDTKIRSDMNLQIQIQILRMKTLSITSEQTTFKEYTREKGKCTVQLFKKTK